MGVVQNIIGMVRDINDRNENSQISDIMKNNYLTDPDAAIKAVYQINPDKGLALQQQHLAAVAAQQKAVQDQGTTDLGIMRQTLRGLPAGSDYGAAFDTAAPAFQAMGMNPNHLAAMRAAVVANPSMLMDDKAYDEFVKGQNTNTVANPGAHVIRGDKVIDTVPYAMKPVTTHAGNTATSTGFDPNTGQFITGQGGGSQPAPGAGAGGLLTVDSLRPLIKQQENSGSYLGSNSKSGTLGAYQINPKEGPALAQAAGLPWRPDMMVKDDPASQRYQDKLGGIRIQQAIDAGGGNPQAVFSHYYSGSPTAYTRPQGNPKTAQYVRDMMTRLNGGDPRAAGGSSSSGGVSVGPGGVTVAGAAKPGNTKTDMTPQEVAAMGLPPGTVAQRDSNGGVHVLSKPSAASQKNVPTYDKFAEADSGMSELEQNLIKLRDDPGLRGSTGMMGSILSHIPGTHSKYLQGLIDQISSQKMIGLLSSLQANGSNPFSRVTNMEAGTLPKTLGNLKLDQNYNDLNTVINDALHQVHSMHGRLRDSALQNGIIDQQGNRINHNAPAANAGPAVGTVVRGFRFKGGNPADQNNWEQQ